MSKTSMKLGALLDGVGGGTWGWLRDGVRPDASVSIENYIAEAQAAEAAGLDYIFIADTLHITTDSSPHYLNRLEPVSMLSAIAARTNHIGLVATITTSYSEPFTVARQLASLDIISGGRAGWNVVTTALQGVAANYSRDAHYAAKDRYRRGQEHVEVVQGLWDSWEDDAFIADRKNRRFFDPSKMHALNHEGEYFQVAGPLNIGRSPQGQPVIFQAGASESGRHLAAQIADAVFGVPRSFEEAKEYRDDIHARRREMGGDTDALLFLPSIHPVIGSTEEEAERKFAAGRDLVTYEEGLKWISFFFSYHDFRQYDPDGPFPDLEDLGHDSYRSLTDRIKDMGESGMTLREITSNFALPRTEFIGTPEKVADACEDWFRRNAVDGFMIGSGIAPLQDFYDQVVPILRSRGLRPENYTGSTFRENLGLPFVENRYAKAKQDALVNVEAAA